MTGKHGRRGNRPPSVNNERLLTVVIAVVLVVWVVNFAAALTIESYEPSDAVNAIFLLIVSALYARRGHGGSED